MDSKLLSKLNNLDELAIGYYHLILTEKIKNHTDDLQIINLPELFVIIETNFDKFEYANNLNLILPILHNTILLTKAEIRQEECITFLEKSFRIPEREEIVLQFLYQILKSLEVIINDFNAITTILVELMLRKDNTLIRTRSLICLKILFDKFQLFECLDKIWNKIKACPSTCVDIFPHLIDYFLREYNTHMNTTFWDICVRLLSSSGRDERKCGVYLIQRTIEFMLERNSDFEIKNYFKWNGIGSKTTWLQYLTIFENLEEKQSHLILPSLEMLPRIEIEDIWMRVLLMQMLQHGNVLVIRWSVDFILKKYTSKTIHSDVLNYFLNALNNTFLFSEYSEKLEIENMKKFVTADVMKLLKSSLLIDWKPVPMHVLFNSIDKNNLQLQIDKMLILDIAAKIRKLQNRSIRTDLKNKFFELFGNQIQQFGLTDYLRLLEAILNSNEKIPNSFELYAKLVNCKNVDDVEISLQLFKILSNSRLEDNIQEEFLKLFDPIPIQNHNWFKLLAVFTFKRNEKLKHFVEKYSLNFDEISSKFDTIINSDICDILSFLKHEYSVIVSDKSEQPVVMEKVVDWYSNSCANLELALNGMDLLIDAGGPDTVEVIGEAIGKTKLTIDSEHIDRLVNELKSMIKRFGADTPYSVASNIVKYCLHRNDIELLDEYVNNILNIDPSNITLTLNVYDVLLQCKSIDYFQSPAGINILIKGLTFGDPLYGDEKTEYDYVICRKLYYVSSSKIRNRCLEFLNDLKDTNQLREQLLQLSLQLNEKKPRYFENSKQHRLKLRISHALATLESISSLWDERFLTAIVRESNQSNVTYIHERIVANAIPKERLNGLLNEIATHSNSSQVSIFAIAFMVCKIRNDPELAEDCIRRIFPWTMGQNFATRLYAQIAVYHLIKDFTLTNWEPILHSISESFEKQHDPVQNFQKLNEDVRFNFCQNMNILSRDTINAILYITNVPDDEFDVANTSICEKSIQMKKSFVKKDIVENKKTSTIEDVQRKMNPVKELFDPCLLCYSSADENKALNKMIVVASLIDKLPNLGGIARTCEVLGIKNLVLESLKQAQHKEFKNLSMTAENWLNLTELKPKLLENFLMEKKIEGYSVVGAEQTANSVNFVDFKFPRKCILLLGHEKEGIPANLISLLDYAVEIPQFGMVRSLNVHVTGALFMWEYCKQNLVKGDQ